MPLHTTFAPVSTRDVKSSLRPGLKQFGLKDCVLEGFTDKYISSIQILLSDFDK